MASCQISRCWNIKIQSLDFDHAIASFHLQRAYRMLQWWPSTACNYSSSSNMREDKRHVGCQRSWSKGTWVGTWNERVHSKIQTGQNNQTSMASHVLYTVWEREREREKVMQIKLFEKPELVSLMIYVEPNLKLNLFAFEIETNHWLIYTIRWFILWN